MRHINYMHIYHTHQLVYIDKIINYIHKSDTLTTYIYKKYSLYTYIRHTK